MINSNQPISIEQNANYALVFLDKLMAERFIEIGIKGTDRVTVTSKEYKLFKHVKVHGAVTGNIFKTILRMERK